MAIEQTVTCDLCGAPIVKKERNRFAFWRRTPAGDLSRVAVRRDQDRPESAEYLDIGPCCHQRPIGDLIKLADSNRPEDASGYKA